MAEKKAATSRATSSAPTRCVASSGKPHFYGEEVKLSDEEAKPLLKEGKVSKE